MLQVDKWSFRCATCGWEVRSQQTVNYQDSVADALIRLHLQSHESSRAVPAVASSSESPVSVDATHSPSASPSLASPEGTELATECECTCCLGICCCQTHPKHHEQAKAYRNSASPDVGVIVREMRAVIEKLRREIRYPPPSDTSGVVRRRLDEMETILAGADHLAPPGAGQAEDTEDTTDAH